MNCKIETDDCTLLLGLTTLELFTGLKYFYVFEDQQALPAEIFKIILAYQECLRFKQLYNTVGQLYSAAGANDTKYFYIFRCSNIKEAVKTESFDYGNKVPFSFTRTHP